MAKLCKQCFHTPLGICHKHNDKDEYSRKFCLALEIATKPLIEATTREVFMPKEERYPWMFKQRRTAQ
jgi:hypothetical protein